MKTNFFRYPIVAVATSLLLVVVGCEQKEEQVLPPTKSDKNARTDYLYTPYDFSSHIFLDPSFLNAYSLANGQPSVSPADAALRNDYDNARQFASECLRYGVVLTAAEVSLFTIYPNLVNEMRSFMQSAGNLSIDAAKNVYAAFSGSQLTDSEKNTLNVAAYSPYLPDPFSRYISTRILYCIYANNARLAE